MRPHFLLAAAVAVANFAPVTGPLGGWLAGGSSQAFAQSQLQAPAELPPAGYRAMQYVDSRGCAFVRAGTDAQPVWVPRVTRDRQQICGQPPSQTGRVVAPVAPPAVTVAAEAPRALPSAPAVETPSPRAIPLAEACQGRSGPLAGYVDAQTGQPVTCGPAPVPVPVAADGAPAPRPVPVATTGALTLAQACAGKSGPLTGYVSAATGEPVECPAAPATIGVATAAVTQTVAADGPRARYGQSGSGQGVLINPDGPVPASNAVGLSPVAGPPAGYNVAFEDGRLNPRRGPQGGALVGAVAHDLSRQVTAPDAQNATAVGAGHRFVQVGAYGQSANAERAVATLRSLGLPVTVSGSARGLQSVAAGPFGDANAAQTALRTLRNAGFGDAYTR